MRRHIPRNNGLISRYEALRQQVLGQPSETFRGQGLALLMRNGMSAWMQAWSQCTGETPVSFQEASGNDEIFPLDMHKEVAMILAGMVLYGRQEASV